MASLNLAGKTSGYVKLTAPDDSSNNPTVTLPTESGELALKSDIGEGGSGGEAQPPIVVRGLLDEDQTVVANEYTVVEVSPRGDKEHWDEVTLLLNQK